MTEEEIQARIRRGINDGIRKIEEGRRLDVLFTAFRMMDRDERARVVRKIFEVFGPAAGLNTWEEQHDPLPTIGT